MKDKIECEIHDGEYSSKKALELVNEREEPKPSALEMEKSRTVFRNSGKLEQCDEVEVERGIKTSSLTFPVKEVMIKWENGIRQKQN